MLRQRSLDITWELGTPKFSKGTPKAFRRNFSSPRTSTPSNKLTPVKVLAGAFDNITLVSKLSEKLAELETDNQKLRKENIDLKSTRQRNELLIDALQTQINAMKQQAYEMLADEKEQKTSYKETDV